MFSAVFNAIVKAAVGALNSVIAGIGAALQAAINLLPDMPALPDLPPSFVTAESWVAWFWPIGTTVDVLTFVLGMFIIWNLVAVVLRWARGLS